MFDSPDDRSLPVSAPQSAIPYSRHALDDSDIAAVVVVLRGNWLTTGPKIAELEQAVVQATGTEHAVALSSGTAALHGAMHVLDLQPGDEVIVPAITFAASANAVLYAGGTPVFADVEPDTLLIDVASAARLVTPRTRAIVAVDYAGQPCDYDALRDLCARHSLTLVADACHSLGGAYRSRPVGTLADLSTFSLHPMKVVTACEGGVVTTANATWAERLRRFRNHGIATDHRQREALGTWYYEQLELGYNYRLSDVHAALGASQIKKLSGWIEQRRQLAAHYDDAFRDHPGIVPLVVRSHVHHAYHLYVVRLQPAHWRIDRRQVFSALRQGGIGVQVHYIPVHLHPYYQQRLGTHAGMCPVAENAYEQILSLPLFPAMSLHDVQRVVDEVQRLWQNQ